jgi:septal ring factor EnvC (AmiA/AmiB activator)
MASSSIHVEAQSLSLQLAELTALSEKVTKHRDDLAKIQAGFDKQRKELVSQLSDRTALQNKLGKRQKEEEETLQRLAKKASDLRDLVSGIQKEEARKEEIEAKRNKPSAKVDSQRLRSFVDAKGRINPPASGQIVQSFGSSQGKNATSKGITMLTRRGAQVTSPYDSEVVFTGPFLNYGQMIILRHSDDFHTLLAGLTKIDVRVGQFLLEGEPIGAMGESDNATSEDHKLYIELRKDNQPVNPALWINGLKKR